MPVPCVAPRATGRTLHVLSLHVLFGPLHSLRQVLRADVPGGADLSPQPLAAPHLCVVLQRVRAAKVLGRVSLVVEPPHPAGEARQGPRLVARLVGCLRVVPRADGARGGGRVFVFKSLRVALHDGVAHGGLLDGARQRFYQALVGLVHDVRALGELGRTKAARLASHVLVRDGGLGDGFREGAEAQRVHLVVDVGRAAEDVSAPSRRVAEGGGELHLGVFKGPRNPALVQVVGVVVHRGRGARILLREARRAGAHDGVPDGRLGYALRQGRLDAVVDVVKLCEGKWGMK
mmetsp:Transcript_9765/g.15726  ORF Transcript_9765/g.15726 Transcript_9765/m.15726 type:complete len:290 (-) Transcript_9765:510-1379(-)